MSRRLKTALIILGILIALALLHVTTILIPLENAVRGLLSPVARVVTSMGSKISYRLENFETLNECKDKTTDLEHRLTSLSVDYVRLRALEEENAVLRKTLDYLQKQGYDGVMAHIISRSVVPMQADFMIDRGSRDGLEIGMAAMVENGVYVGKISKLYDRTAVITLTSDPSSRVAISLAGQHRLIGLVEGQGNGSAIATLIPQQESLHENDILVTAGTEEKVPANLIVGMANRVMGLPTDPFKTATIEPMISPEYLEVVTILRPRALSPE